MEDVKSPKLVKSPTNQKQITSPRSVKPLTSPRVQRKTPLSKQGQISSPTVRKGTPGRSTPRSTMSAKKRSRSRTPVKPNEMKGDLKMDATEPDKNSRCIVS